MTKAIFIVGAPGSGKTTAAVRLMDVLLKTGRYKRLVCTEWPLVPWVELRREDVAYSWRFLGKFDGASYAQGTDRMSMGVQPYFERFLVENEVNLVIEGDRLCNSKSIEACLAYRYMVKVIELRTSQKVRDARYLARGSSQSPSFIKGRLTKIENLRWHMAGDHPSMTWRAFQNESADDADAVHRKLTAWCE